MIPGLYTLMVCYLILIISGRVIFTNERDMDWFDTLILSCLRLSVPQKLRSSVLIPEIDPSNF